MSLRKSRSFGGEKVSSIEEQQAKINEVRKLIGPLSDKLPDFCSDASVSRYLRARNWNTKLMKETMKWRREYKPEAIRWEEIAPEAETGKIYRANYHDKFGRVVLVMRPGFQNTSSTKGQIRYLVYCIENVILNLAADQDQMVWLIDFQGWNMSSISVKVTRETAHVLQDHYPERLGLAILYNLPKIFESFGTMVKPFLENKTYEKVKFVYSDDPDSQKIMEDVFDMDKLESAFGGRNSVGFDFKEFAERMKEDDKKMSTLLSSGGLVLGEQQSNVSILQQSEPSISETHSEASLEISCSSNVASPKLAGINNSSDSEMTGQLSCKKSASAESELQPDLIQPSGS